MNTKLLAEDGEKTWAVIFDEGDEVIEGLTKFAGDEEIQAVRFTLSAASAG